MTMVKMMSKAQFKPQALAWLRQVEHDHLELIITDHGRPVARIVPWHESDPLTTLHQTWAGRVADGSVRYDPAQATEPLPASAWGDLS
jgi:prevent-host-death family protein